MIRATIGGTLPYAEPGESGLRAEALSKLESTLAKRKFKTVVVARGGKIAWEWHESGRDAIGPLFSCTKSVLSALIGIAISEGKLAGINRQIAECLPSSSYRPEHEAITLAHLLTMTAGIDWPDFDKPYRELRAAADPVAYVLGRPLVHPPGRAFAYNSGGSHLLSAALTAATGQTALDYARDKLFLPLGFRGAKWTERGGVNEGGTGLQLHAHDLVKFGQLFLQEGRWEGRRLLPAEWIARSTEAHHRGLLHYTPPIYGSYGYHWWNSPAVHNGVFDCCFAFGHGGQYTLIAPGEELVAVIRKAPTGRNMAIHSRELLFTHIASALR